MVQQVGLSLLLWQQRKVRATKSIAPVSGRRGERAMLMLNA